MIEPARRLFRALTTLALGLAMTLGLSPMGVGAANAQGLLGEPRYAAIVVDASSGEVLYAKRADAQRFPASITKVMTLYLAFEAMATGRLSPSDIVLMSPHAANQAPSKLGLRPGEGITVDMALQAIAVKSANDVAVAIAERIGGSEERFAQLMTLRAQELGMTNTRFANASGLPNPRNISSARDIAILSRAVMHDYPQYYGYFGERSFTFRGRVEQNHNGLLRKMPGVDGLKTGYIGASGFNLAASAIRDGRRLIAVVLGGSSTATRDENVETLLNAGFEVLHRRSLGQRVTLASIAEPEDNGPIQRPSTEEGDGGQAGVQVELAESLRGPQGIPNDLAQARNPGMVARVVGSGPDVDDCARIATTVKGRHGHRVHKVVTRCGRAARRTTVATGDPCAHKRGKAKRSCERTEKPLRGRHEVAETETRAPTQSGDGFLIQVGAFKSKSDARAQLAKVSRRYADAIEGASPQVQPGGGGYRARFTGFSAAEAKAACRVLSAKGERCMVMSAS